MTPIPKNGNEVTLEFLKNVLKDEPFGQHLTGFDGQFNTMQGATGVLLKFTLQYDTNVDSSSFPKTVVIKFATAIVEHYNGASKTKRMHLKNCAAYRKEVGFYRYLLHNKEKHRHLFHLFPKIHYVDINEDELDQFVIVMEDLQVGEEAHAGDQINGCSFEEAKRVFESWAKVQASFWHQPSESEATLAALHQQGMTAVNPLWQYLNVCVFFTEINGEVPFTQENIQRMVDTFNSKWSAFEDVILSIDYSQYPEFKDTRLPEVTKKIGEWVAQGKAGEDIKRGIRAHCIESPQTLCHCDFRLDNMIFSKDAVRFVDFQCTSLGTCAYDLAQFVAQCLPSEQRQKHEDELLKVSRFFSLGLLRIAENALVNYFDAKSTGKF
eukprot:GEZU01010922.1.p1 GENE.GEZU01010922.1~~GEZU01010922.1.p1  ORF type:complete len:380 (+),score=87.76 GEZU01010922.1:44-1183(+)